MKAMEVLNMTIMPGCIGPAVCQKNFYYMIRGSVSATLLLIRHNITAFISAG